MEDAALLSGIVDLLEKEEVDTQTIAMTRHISTESARRLCKKLLTVGIIERKTVTQNILGTPQQVPQGEWKLTPAIILSGRVFDVEKLARGL